MAERRSSKKSIFKSRNKWYPVHKSGIFFTKFFVTDIEHIVTIIFGVVRYQVREMPNSIWETCYALKNIKIAVYADFRSYQVPVQENSRFFWKTYLPPYEKQFDSHEHSKTRIHI